MNWAALTDEERQAAAHQARAMRKGHVGWSQVARRLGVGEYGLRAAIEPDYAARKRESNRKNYNKRAAGSGVRAHDRPHAAHTSVHQHAAALAAQIPVDTRSFTGRLLGDPLPSRSALDQRLKVSAPKHKWWTP